MQLPFIKKTARRPLKRWRFPTSLLAGEPNDHAIWLAVRSEEAAQPSGNACHQDPQFRARRRPQAVPSEGTRHGPSGHDPFAAESRAAERSSVRSRTTITVKLTDKVAPTRRRSALIYKAREDRIRVVEDFSLDAPRTRDMVESVRGAGLDEREGAAADSGFDSTIAQERSQSAERLLAKGGGGLHARSDGLHDDRCFRKARYPNW